MPSNLIPPQIIDPDLRILTTDAPGPGGAHHAYRIAVLGAPLEQPLPDGTTVTTRAPSKTLDIEFQNGGKQEVGANGVTNEALLEIVRHRLACFQAGDFACKENASALSHVEDALRWLQRRTAKRQRRGVEGKSVK